MGCNKRDKNGEIAATSMGTIRGTYIGSKMGKSGDMIGEIMMGRKGNRENGREGSKEKRREGSKEKRREGNREK